MTNKVLLKKSSVAGKVPTTTDLAYGELALNYADGKLYFKDTNNSIQKFSNQLSINDLTDVDTTTSLPNVGDVLKWNGTNWVPGTDSTVGGSGTDADTLDGFDSSYFLNYNNLTNKPTLFSGNYNDLTNKPILFSGDYNDLTNKPSLASVATSGSYNDLINKPTLAAVATSGSYNDLLDKPSLSGYATETYVNTSINNLINGAPGTLDTLKEIADALQADENALGALTTVVSSKIGFSDLSVTIAPAEGRGTLSYNNTNGLFTFTPPNLSNYVLSSSLSAVATSGSYNDLTNKPTLFSGDYNDLTNRPTLFSGNYNDLTNKPDLTTKQDTLVSGTNIKTINGQSLLGSGNITLTSGGASALNDLTDVEVQNLENGLLLYYNGSQWVGTQLKSINGQGLFGEGNLTISGGSSYDSIKETSTSALRDLQTGLFNNLDNATITSSPLAFNDLNGSILLQSNTQAVALSTIDLPATFEFWHYPTSTVQPDSRIFSIIGDSLNGSQQVSIMGRGGIYFTNTTGTVSGGSQSIQKIPNVNSWNHYVIYVSTTEAVTWINGEKANTTTFPVNSEDYRQTVAKNRISFGYLFAASAIQPNGYFDGVKISFGDIYGKNNSNISVPTSKFTADGNTTHLLQVSKKYTLDVDANLVLSPGNKISGDGSLLTIPQKQDTLISGMNIKSINGESLLGSGNINVATYDQSLNTTNAVRFGQLNVGISGGLETIIYNDSITINGVPAATETYVDNQLTFKQNTLISGTNIKTINGQSLLGSGNITITGGSGQQEYSVQVQKTLANPSVVIDFIPIADCTSARYNFVMVNDLGHYETTEFVVIHNGTLITYQKYNQFTLNQYTGDITAELGLDPSTQTAILVRFTPNSDLTNIKFTRNIISSITIPSGGGLQLPEDLQNSDAGIIDLQTTNFPDKDLN